jgi:hypothetical protein
MTYDQICLLNAISARWNDVIAAPEPRGFNCGIARAQWLDDVTHGPRLPTSQVFGTTEAGRKRASRTLRRLEDAGLVTVWRPGGVAIRAKLTAKGEALAADPHAKESLSPSAALPRGPSEQITSSEVPSHD